MYPDPCSQPQASGEGDGAAGERIILAWLLQQCGIPADTFDRLRPDFLIISPPKTGSSWLAANLRCHPQIFVPSIKEVKYFSSFMRWLDWSWYLHQFDPAGDRLKGEASPSYALLPVERIRLVRRLLPDVKLIFLMREPTLSRVLQILTVIGLGRFIPRFASLDQALLPGPAAAG